MRLPARLVTAAIWVARYGPTLFLCSALVWAILAPTIWGETPTPQSPPDGYLSETLRVRLSWSRGDAKKELKLQIAEGRPDFSKPLYEHVSRGTTHTPSGLLKRGRTYYWRLEQSDDAIVAWFRTSPSGVSF